MILGAMWLSFLLLAGGQPGEVRVDEIKSKDVVDLLSGLTLVYDSGRKTAFRMRAFLYQTDGECSGDAICEKDELLVATSTFDEYPEKKAYRLKVLGAYKRVSVLGTPKNENGSFAIALYTEPKPGEESCSAYVVTLKEMRPRAAPCR